MKEKEAENRASFHILQLAEQGRPVEIVAQTIASWFLSGELSAAQVTDNKLEIEERVLDLMLDPSEIWERLMPGPGYDEELVVVNKKDLPHKASLDELFTPESYKDEPTFHEPNGIDEYTYLISIVIDPRIRHDNPTDLIEEAQTVSSTSPLNLAQHIWDRIDRLDKIGKWPAEELSAWITHRASDRDFLMTFDQAEGILALERASIKLELQDFDDLFQAEYEQMIIAGQEYAAGKEFSKKARPDN